VNKTFEFKTPGTLEAPGPMGRLLRLGIGVLLAWLIYQWIFGGGEISPANTTLWGWIVFSLLLAPYVINIGWGVIWGKWKPRLLIVAVWGLGALIGALSEEISISGAVWEAIKATQVYIYGHLGLSFLLSALLATPGCEMRAIAQLIGKTTGNEAREHHCPGFIDNVDRWERGLKRSETTSATPSKIQFLHFDGCPLAPAAKVELQAALDSLADSGAFECEEVDLMAEDTPEHLQNWGSPTILVDGRDITGALPGDACGCRVYDRPGSVPSSEEIKAGIERSSER
jgi:hypothetical protein